MLIVSLKLILLVGMINIVFKVEFKWKSKFVMLEYGFWFNGDFVNLIEWFLIEYWLYSGVVLSLFLFCDLLGKKKFVIFLIN